MKLRLPFFVCFCQGTKFDENLDLFRNSMHDQYNEWRRAYSSFVQGFARSFDPMVSNWRTTWFFYTSVKQLCDERTYIPLLLL